MPRFNQIAWAFILTWTTYSTLDLLFSGRKVMIDQKPEKARREIDLRDYEKPHLGQVKDSPFPFFQKTHDLDCEKLFSGDESEKNKAKASKMLPFKDFRWYDNLRIRGCSALDQFYFPKYDKKPGESEEDFHPIAYVINVRQDLKTFIRQIQMLYTPHNTFCIHVDMKAQEYFHRSIGMAANCINGHAGRRQIHVAPRPVPVIFAGNTALEAYSRCLTILTEDPTPWQYVFTLQGHDLPLRTQSEMRQVLELQHGVNLMQLRAQDASQFFWSGGIDEVKDKQGMQVDQLLTEGTRCLPEKVPHNLDLYQGLLQTALTRRFVEFTLQNTVAKQLRERLDMCYEKPIEIFWHTVGHNEKMSPPAFFPGACRGKKDYFVLDTRDFRSPLSINDSECQENKINKGTCSSGIDNLPKLASSKALFFNATLMNDLVTLKCMHELIIRRTYNLDPLKAQDTFDIGFYKTQSTVKYAEWMKTRSTEKFPC